MFGLDLVQQIICDLGVCQPYGSLSLICPAKDLFHLEMRSTAQPYPASPTRVEPGQSDTNRAEMERTEQEGPSFAEPSRPEPRRSRMRAPESAQNSCQNPLSLVPEKTYFAINWVPMRARDEITPSFCMVWRDLSNGGTPGDQTVIKWSKINENESSRGPPDRKYFFIYSLWGQRPGRSPFKLHSAAQFCNKRCRCCKFYIATQKIIFSVIIIFFFEVASQSILSNMFFIITMSIII